MSLSISSLPSGFRSLRGTARPTPEEVDAYAHLIANAEGYPPESIAARLFREAELQLWTWRNELCRTAKKRRHPGPDDPALA